VTAERSPDVCAVIPTLGRSSSLARSVASVLAQDARVVLVVDHPTGAIEVDVASDPRMKVVWSGGGAGYAASTQMGITAADAEYVLLLNDDAWIEGGLTALVDGVASDPTVAGSAPKIRFSGWPHILNSVGTVLHDDASADSRGIGQPDVGQYDARERVFGLHFAAALVRRSLFEDRNVGPLDISYGAYFEDIDWCLRANLLGYTFISVPEATAMHGQSTTMRQRDFSYRYGLQQRNQLLTAFKCFEGRNVARVVGRRSATLAWRAVKRDPLSRGGLTAVAAFARRVPAASVHRAHVQHARVVTDAEVFALSAGERSWFNDVEGPIFDERCLAEAVRRAGPRSTSREAVAAAASYRSHLEGSPGV
jgi:GT2 family glycosyltransferase